MHRLITTFLIELQEMSQQFPASRSRKLQSNLATTKCDKGRANIFFLSHTFSFSVEADESSPYLEFKKSGGGNPIKRNSCLKNHCIQRKFLDDELPQLRL